MPLNIEQAVQRYVAGGTSAAARQKYIDGIQGFQGNPMELAAQQDQFFLQRVTESVTSGKRAAALRAVPVATWKQMAVTKGAPRLGPGMAAAQDKYRAHLQRFAPVYDRITQELATMPRGGLAAAQARSAKAIEIMMTAAGRA